jgi:Xaa-Pro dipeptidase
VNIDLSEQILNNRERVLLFTERLIREDLIRAGRTSLQVQKDIFRFAKEHLFHPYKKKPRFWHKQILRVGDDTVNPYSSSIVDRIIQPGDLAFFDLGPVLNVEVDIGRTIVIPGSYIDPDKEKICKDVEQIFFECQIHYLQNLDLTGQELYLYIKETARKKGWDLSVQEHSGHLIGCFPHEILLGDNDINYIKPGNNVPMSFPDRYGKKRYWVLEIHLIHPSKSFGAFYEDLLNV